MVIFVRSPPAIGPLTPTSSNSEGNAWHFFYLSASCLLTSDSSRKSPSAAFSSPLPTSSSCFWSPSSESPSAQHSFSSDTDPVPTSSPSSTSTIGVSLWQILQIVQPGFISGAELTFQNQTNLFCRFGLRSPVPFLWV